VLHLPDVTLVSIFTVAHELSRLAIGECVSRVKFGDIKVFTDRPQDDEICVGPFDTGEQVARFAIYGMPGYIKTRYILLIQWDSWVINPEAWSDEFLKYDYMGAPWWYRDPYNVGNSGFCLRSKALIDFLAANEEAFPLALPEDHVLCRNYQRRLPQFKWAPEQLAWRFSFERTMLYPADRVFGFHGLFNWPRVLSPVSLQKRLCLVEQNEYARNRPEWHEVRHLLRRPVAEIAGC
jgi:hypothetical protein